MTGLSSGPIWGWGHRRVQSGANQESGRARAAWGGRGRGHGAGLRPKA